MLSVAGYSQPINKIINLETLKKKIFSLKKQPNAVPYVNFFIPKTGGFVWLTKIRKNLILKSIV